MKLINTLLTIKAFFICIVKRSNTRMLKDVSYHTGYYRFSKYFGTPKEYSFKIDGIPCLVQYGMENFVFFSETNLVGKQGVIPVEIYYA